MKWKSSYVCFWEDGELWSHVQVCADLVPVSTRGPVGRGGHHLLTTRTLRLSLWNSCQLSSTMFNGGLTVHGRDWVEEVWPTCALIIHSFPRSQKPTEAGVAHDRVILIPSMSKLIGQNTRKQEEQYMKFNRKNAYKQLLNMKISQ